MDMYSGRMERWAQGCYPEIAEIKEEEIETDEQRYQRVIQEADEEIALLKEMVALVNQQIEIQEAINELWRKPIAEWSHPLLVGSDGS